MAETETRMVSTGPEPTQADMLLDRWMEWCFDTQGSKARPDKWTREYLEGRPMTGADALARAQAQVLALQEHNQRLLEVVRSTFYTFDGNRRHEYSCPSCFEEGDWNPAESIVHAADCNVGKVLSDHPGVAK